MSDGAGWCSRTQLIYINDVLFGIKIDSRAALFVGKMSVLVTENNLSELQTSSTSILNYGVNGLQ